jgi:O-antigen/teichoic acid export membrane protein
MRIPLAKGVAWMMAFKLGDRALGLVSTVILARLLVPADFGLVAMAMSIIMLVELASAFGFEAALIQRQDATRDHYDTAWTLNVIAGIVCGLGMMAVSYLAAGFYREPRLIAVIVVLSTAWMVQGFENVGIVAFRKELTFHREFLFMGAKKLAGFCVTIPLAIWLENHWALVAGTVAGRFAGVVLSYLMHDFRPRFRIRAWRDLFSFSSWLVLNNALSFVLVRLSHFFVGKLYGAAALGVYNLGEQISSLATTEMVQPINRAVFPAYAKMAADLARLREGFLGVIAAIATFVMPATVGVAATAALAVDVMLGQKWRAATPIVEVLAFSCGIAALGTNIYSAYLALGMSSVQPKLAFVRLLLFVPIMYAFSSWFGFVGIAYAELVTALLYLIINYPTLFRVLDIGIAAYLARIWRPGAASCVMGASVYWVREILAGLAPVPGSLVRLIILIAIGITVYVGALLGLWNLLGRPDGPERSALTIARNRLLGWSQRRSASSADK